jgi:hypothetical protein
MLLQVRQGNMTILQKHNCFSSWSTCVTSKNVDILLLSLFVTSLDIPLYPSPSIDPFLQGRLLASTLHHLHHILAAVSAASTSLNPFTVTATENCGRGGLFLSPAAAVDADLMAMTGMDTAGHFGALWEACYSSEPAGFKEESLSSLNRIEGPSLPCPADVPG